jgi:hypothetical protein
MLSIESNPWGFARFQKVCFTVHLAFEYFISMWILLVALLVSIATLHEYWRKEERNKVTGAIIFVGATLLSTVCNIASALYDFNYIRNHIGEVRMLADANVEMDRCRTALHDMQKSKRRFRQHFVCWVVCAFAISHGVYTIYFRKIYLDSFVFAVYQIAIVFLIAKSVLLNIYPIIRFWIMYVLFDYALPYVHLGGIHLNSLELNTMEVQITDETDEICDHECVICFEDYVEDNSARRLRCGHVFHKTCIDSWFLRSSVCPLCKSDMNN